MQKICYICERNLNELPPIIEQKLGITKQITEYYSKLKDKKR